MMIARLHQPNGRHVLWCSGGRQEEGHGSRSTPNQHWAYGFGRGCTRSTAGSHPNATVTLTAHGQPGFRSGRGTDHGHNFRTAPNSRVRQPRQRHPAPGAPAPRTRRLGCPIPVTTRAPRGPGVRRLSDGGVLRRFGDGPQAVRPVPSRRLPPAAASCLARRRPSARTRSSVVIAASGECIPSRRDGQKFCTKRKSIDLGGRSTTTSSAPAASEPAAAALAGWSCRCRAFRPTAERLRRPVDGHLRSGLIAGCGQHDTDGSEGVPGALCSPVRMYPTGQISGTTALALAMCAT